MPGGPEWIIIGAVIVLLFGAKKLPDLAHSLGRSSREFKKGLKGGDEEASTSAKKAEDSPEG
jgi:sec-independent protein translocase protein TatA